MKLIGGCVKSVYLGNIKSPLQRVYLNFFSRSLHLPKWTRKQFDFTSYLSETFLSLKALFSFLVFTIYCITKFINSVVLVIIVLSLM